MGTQKVIHLKIRDKSCDQCEFTATKNSAIIMLKRAVHDKIRDWHCDECNYKAKYLGNLKRHTKSVHNGIRDHHCNLCEFKTSASGSLNRHIRVVHNGIEDKKLSKAGPKPILSEHQRTKNSCVSYSNEQVKAALEKIQSTQISKDSEDSSLFSICPTK